MHTQPPANRLRELRDSLGVTQKEIAMACGVDQASVSRWEDKFIPQQHLHIVANVLKVSVPYLTGWSDDEREAA